MFIKWFDLSVEVEEEDVEETEKTYTDAMNSSSFMKGTIHKGRPH